MKNSLPMMKKRMMPVRISAKEWFRPNTLEISLAPRLRTTIRRLVKIIMMGLNLAIQETMTAVKPRPPTMVVVSVWSVPAVSSRPMRPQIAPETDNTNSCVIDMSDFDFGDEEMNRTVQEMVENDRKQKEQRGRSGAIFFGLGAAVCFVRAAMPWRKKERAETISDDSASKEAEEIPVSPKPVETAAPQSAETDSREDRLENLKRLYEAGILSREEYDERRKKL